MRFEGIIKSNSFFLCAGGRARITALRIDMSARCIGGKGIKVRLNRFDFHTVVLILGRPLIGFCCTNSRTTVMYVTPSRPRTRVSNVCSILPVSEITVVQQRSASPALLFEGSQRRRVPELRASLR